MWNILFEYRGSSVNKTFKRQGENIRMEIVKRKVIKGRSHVEGYQKPAHREASG